ncbi:uncharacterized protein LOC107263017 [Cephus cinctus]|uniref:Uncharacterized protein LOC107263017 n=1 Tax=Cephus cinctus TaxID=211228 RepID=A0AAJ7FCP4_CEPCN|nr:uncharacterized protein LOC107263017 [Cephus cinctus]
MRLGVSRRTKMPRRRLTLIGPGGPGSLIAIALTLLSLSVSASSSSSEQSSATLWAGLGGSCSAEDPRNSSVSCHGVRIVRRVVQQLLDKSGSLPSLELSDGVTLVETPGAAERSVNGGSARSARRMKTGQDGPMGQLFEFLEDRELRVKLPSLLPDNLELALKESLPSAGQGRKGGGGGGGLGGGKKGDGGMLLMALMMGKMMSALGFGALGLLAMKALMVSALALMLSLIVAAKKLAGGHDDGGGHHVVYAQEVGHHHRKRSVSSENFSADYLNLNLPYRGYAELYATRSL